MSWVRARSAACCATAGGGRPTCSSRRSVRRRAARLSLQPRSKSPEVRKAHPRGTPFHRRDRSRHDQLRARRGERRPRRGGAFHPRARGPAAHKSARGRGTLAAPVVPVPAERGRFSGGQPGAAMDGWAVGGRGGARAQARRREPGAARRFREVVAVVRRGKQERCDSALGCARGGAEDLAGRRVGGVPAAPARRVEP